MYFTIGKNRENGKKFSEKILLTSSFHVYSSLTLLFPELIPMFSLTDYTYTLPEDLIAQSAMQPHHDARMMMIDRETGELIEESTFWNIDTFLGDDRVIFFNNSRVIPARIRLE